MKINYSIDFVQVVFFYFLEEATMHFRKAFPDLVRFNDELIIFAFARMFKTFIRQRAVADDVQVFTYTKNGNNNNEHKIHNE